jgi:orotate phosphoribosyltransferase
VISAGTSVLESVDIIRSAGATPCGVVICFDRMERGSGTLSAVEEVRNKFGIPAVSISTLDDLAGYLSEQSELAQQLRSLEDYRAKYGVIK